MSMGYSACFSEVIDNDTLIKVVGDKALVDDFVQQYDNYDFGNLSRFELNESLNTYHNKKRDESKYAEIYKAWHKLYTAFKEATGLTLLVDYHDKEDDGDRYDEVNGMFFCLCVSELYQPTEKYKKLMEKFGEDVVDRKFYVSFG
jgi:hypothetical protein